jgi:hypothetical protein
MTQTEALRLALEALESSDKLINGDERKMGLCDALDGYYGFGSDIEKYNKQTNKVIKDIKEALAQLEHCSDCGKKLGGANHIHTCSPQQEAKDEPVAWMVYTQEGQSAFVTDNPAVIHPSQRALPLYATPQRTWVGLTDEEIEDFVSALWPVGAGAGKLLRAVEAKLKEKNT